MRLIEDFPKEFHLRMRDQNQVDDIIIRVDDFVKQIVTFIEDGGDFELDSFFDPDLDDSVPVSVTTGNYEEDTYTVGDLRGLTWQEIIEFMLFKGVTDPQTAPTGSLAGSGANLIEVGTTINPTLTGTFNQNDGGAVTSVSLERDNVEIATSLVYTDTGLTTDTPATFTYDMIINYDEGPIPNDTQGNPDPSAQIPAGSIQTNNVSYQFIYPIFYGISNDNNIDAADIAAGNKVVTNDTTPTVNFGASSSQYSWIAVPSTYSDFTSWFVTDLNNGSIGAGQTFGSPSIVAVTTVEWTGVNYDLYVTNFTTVFDEPVTFS